MENLYTVDEVFSNRIFHVPDYQRGYAWGQQQRQDFVEDLDLLGEGKEHFLGLLILHGRDSDPARVYDQKGRAYIPYDLVDGQQRLTTLVVFLHALHQEMTKHSSLLDLAEGLEETYLVTRDMNGQPLCKLTLNRDTHGFFYGTVLEQSPGIQGPAIRSHQFLADAKAHFAAHLETKRQLLGDGFPDWLKAQYLKVTQQLTLVLYTVKNEADAGVVFETMNNRGKPLTELEKVKNYLLYLASKLELLGEHDLARDINDTWTHIFERLMAADLGEVENEDQLLRTHWLMEYDHDRNKRVGIRSIKERFALSDYQARHPDLLDDVKAYLASLRNAAVAYCDIFRPRHPSAYGAFKADKGLRSRLVAAGERLARLGAPVTFLPLLMAVRIRYPENGDACLETLELCERFAFRVYRWLERPAYTGQSWVFRLGYQLFHAYERTVVLNELRAAILNYCPDSQISERFARQDVDWFRWPGLKYMLYEYEQHLAEVEGKAVRMPWEDLTRKQDTVEHILPQAPDPGGYWALRFSAGERGRWLHDIGNLTLTFDNSALGYKPFPDKKGAVGQRGCYADSMLFIEKAIASYDDWTPDTIQARRQEIAAWTAERWKVSPVAVPPPIKKQDLIVRILRRRFLPQGQMLLYKVLWDAGDEGLPYDELHRRMGVSGGELAGVLGALGHRINRTSGLDTNSPGILWLLHMNQADGVWVYAMQPELRATIEALPRLLDIMTSWSLTDIRTKYDKVWHKHRNVQRGDLGFDAWGTSWLG